LQEYRGLLSRAGQAETVRPSKPMRRLPKKRVGMRRRPD
jgi:hypothetical protein